MKSKLTIVGVAISALLLTACVPPQNRKAQNADGSQPAAASPQPQQTGYVRIGQTPLKNIFEDSTSGGAKNPAFPRVALRVTGIRGPGSSSIQLNQGGCLLFSATIWRSSAKSEAVKEFAVCTADLDSSPYTRKTPDPVWKDGRVLVSYHEYDNGQWARWAAKGETTLSNTQYKRTDGPLPPRFALDQDAMNQRGWNAIARGSFVSHFAYALRNMGYMLSRDDMDGRLWVVSVDM